MTSHPHLAHTIRESFANAGFSKITLNIIDTISQYHTTPQNSTQFATQIVGYPCALQSVKEKLESTVAHMQPQQVQCVCLAFQDFLVEISTDKLILLFVFKINFTNCKRLFIFKVGLNWL